MGTGVVAPEPTDPGHADNWHGGSYELSIKLGSHDDSRLDVALRALWEAASLGQAFRRNPNDSTTQPADVSAASVLAGSLHAVAPIAGLGSVLCSVLVVREETYEAGETLYGADWLDLCLPLGSLGNLDRRVGAYPFDTTGSREWRTPVELWFERVGRAVFAACPYAHAVTGFEVSGSERSEVGGGWVGLLTPSAAGELEFIPVANW